MMIQLRYDNNTLFQHKYIKLKVNDKELIRMVNLRPNNQQR